LLSARGPISVPQSSITIQNPISEKAHKPRQALGFGVGGMIGLFGAALFLYLAHAVFPAINSKFGELDIYARTAGDVLLHAGRES
jgi:hypothetical protein